MALDVEGVVVGPTSRRSSSSSPLDDRLGYLLKHVQLGFAEVSAQVLQRVGVSGRQAAVLALVADGEPRSQNELALVLGIDRTTMVAILDELETAGQLTRRAHDQDRRRNVVALTPKGERVLHDAEAARADAEARFLSPLTPGQRDAFVATLRRLITD
jgi:DNA-binding MarR family transcriptional regulator